MDDPGATLLDHLGELKRQVDHFDIAEDDAREIRGHLAAIESEIRTAAFRARSGDSAQQQVYTTGLRVLTECVEQHLTHC